MSKNSKVLALKYRPQVLKELVGQDIVASTIYNSIKFKKIPNAYLFTGIRGVGKTTIARIVAKSLNCKNDIDDLCKNKFCESCESISNSNHIDVLEMDAASKTGVDDVRDLIEFSRYGPTSGKYKIFIIDEVHMLSKQAFNALLKTLEEPPQYLKFIFATTEIKKIPVTVLSRCQRFDLQRVKSNELFEYLKKISNLENGNISDEALKLIVKISEGSVRDSLSLLDRGLISKNDGDQLDLKKAQEIFGYFDKSILINLFKYIFEGNEDEVMKIYKLIYNAGIEPKIFLNDFLEILYYFKNIDTLKLEGTSFSLNDSEFSQISEISKKIDNQILILFWQFAINTLSELDIVSNQNIAVEMFLIRLLYLKKSENQDDLQSNVNKSSIESKASTKTNYQVLKQENKNKSNTKVIDQIKNVSQKDEIAPKLNLKESTEKIAINDFDKLVEICNLKKEAKLKYELESNVNLVSFSTGRIEISIDNRLDKNFVKLLSEKLYEWTAQRWLISFSKEKGKPTLKEKNISNKQLLIEQYKDSNQYRELKNLFSDAELIEVKNEDNNP
tara:strand:+ start:5464 stop:7137 length:1674 start_codon:yes stop_codon:yes gene_type:complete